MAARLVIYEPESARRCSGNCSRIKEIAQDAVASWAIDVKHVSRWPDVTGGQAPDLVILRAPVNRALMDALGALRQQWQSIRVLAAVCRLSETFSDLASWLRNGLDDFVCCPFQEIDFVTRLRRWIPERAPRPNQSSAFAKLDMLIGQSPPFWHAISRIPQIARSNAPVLLGGETGVGKELFARAIHYSGAASSRPFIPINCAALPDHLFENELFGHAKGAYTDAASAEKGLLAAAEGGTVFLDEVDTLSPSAQAKLLRFLQDREYRPLGSSQTLVADARVIAASNADLRTRVAQREFREDLYYRLNILCLQVPPLRERMTDIPLLADHFLARFARQYGRGPLTISSGAMRKMLGHSWPGNVRELESLLHRAVVFGSSDVLGADDIELPTTGVPREAAATAGGLKDHAMEEFERGYLLNLLAEHQGNVSHAAVAAGKDRRTLQRLLRKHSIQRMVFRGAV